MSPRGVLSAPIPLNTPTAYALRSKLFAALLRSISEQPDIKNQTDELPGRRIILNSPHRRQANVGAPISRRGTDGQPRHGPLPDGRDLTRIAADDNAFAYKPGRGQE